MLNSHKIALDANNLQARHFARAAGTARFAYTWAPAEWQRQCEAYKVDASLPKSLQMALRRTLKSLKGEQFPWMLEVTKNAPQMAIIRLGQAFKRFFAGRAKSPTFGKKSLHDRLNLTNEPFSIDGSRIRSPQLGWVRMRETLRLSGKIMSGTICGVADHWLVGITVDTQDDSPLPEGENQGAVGVNLGGSAPTTRSTGEVIAGPKAHQALLARAQRMSRRLSRKVKGSQSGKKAKLKLARLHAQLSSARADALHNVWTDLTRRFHTIGIEDLNVRAGVKNYHLSRAVSDMGFAEFRRQLEYNGAQRGGMIVVANRGYPSGKTRSGCNDKLATLALSVREWTCPACGSVHERDVNAATDLKDRVVGSTVSACAEEGFGLGRKFKAKPASAKQDVSFEPV